jgi:hypothetical protein
MEAGIFFCQRIKDSRNLGGQKKPREEKMVQQGTPKGSREGPRRGSKAKERNPDEQSKKGDLEIKSKRVKIGTKCYKKENQDISPGKKMLQEVFTKFLFLFVMLLTTYIAKWKCII